MNDVIIGIGSNIDPELNILKMLEYLAVDVKVVEVSAMVITKPIGLLNQPDYTNGAVRILTKMGHDEFDVYLKKLEDQMGRDRTSPKFGPRTIDLDIMIWNDEIVDPDYYTREFLRNSAKELGFSKII
jgi:2-amino-4-hydroxy-6-hydroxymethyldihydropteridine diphosphokinase